MKESIELSAQRLTLLTKLSSRIDAKIKDYRHALIDSIWAGQSTGSKALDYELIMTGSYTLDPNGPHGLSIERGKIYEQIEAELIAHQGEIALIEVGPEYVCPEVYLIRLPDLCTGPRLVKGEWQFPAIDAWLVYGLPRRDLGAYGCVADGYLTLSEVGMYMPASWFSEAEPDGSLRNRVIVGTTQVIRRISRLGVWEASYSALHSWGIDTPIDRLDRIRAKIQPPLFVQEQS